MAAILLELLNSIHLQLTNWRKRRLEEETTAGGDHDWRPQLEITAGREVLTTSKYQYHTLNP
jgi:hypothetical protein